MSRPSTSTSFRALGTTAVVEVADPRCLEPAVAAARRVVGAVDAACSRFRPDSELSLAVARPGVAIEVSPLLADALAVALDAAALTDGLVDPTIATALRAWGYDRDFAAMPPGLPPLEVSLRAVPGWRSVQLDREARRLVLAPGVELDLGATGKGFAADRAAEAATAVTGTSVLVAIGGDIAVAGPPPPQAWAVRVTDHHRADPATSDGPVVTIESGGLATSSTTVRRWQRGEVTAHHVMDPRDGRPASSPWRTVSVAASTCAGANAASTAAIVLGAAAPSWLAERGLPARLVTSDGEVTTVAGWPSDQQEVPA